MSIQNLNVFEANHLSGTSYVLFERYFFPRSFFVENFDVLSFLLLYNPQTDWIQLAVRKKLSSHSQQVDVSGMRR